MLFFAQNAIKINSEKYRIKPTLERCWTTWLQGVGATKGAMTNTDNETETADGEKD